MPVRLVPRIRLVGCLTLLCAVLIPTLSVSVSTASETPSLPGYRQDQRTWNSSRSRASQVDDPSFWVYLPLVTHHFVPGIHGQVTYQGMPASSVALHLWRCDNSSCSSTLTTTTEANGVYSFAGAPSLGADQRYYVRFGPNMAPAGDSRYLSNWYGPDILSYTAGDSVAGGDFEIADVAPLLPCTGAIIYLPARFSWQPRQLGSDTHRLLLSDPITGEVVWESADLGYVGGFGFDSLPPALALGRVYRWQVNVYRSSNGFGSSFAQPQIMFLPGPSGIYGRVTYNCAAAAGVVVKLYFHNGVAWSPDPTTTATNAAGIYVFPSPRSLAAGQKYRVGFGPNQDPAGNPSYVYRWYGPDITSYTAGAAVPGGSNDIANFQLLSPPAGATVPLPAQFDWQQRNLGPESYQWVLFNPSSPSTAWRTDLLGDVDGYRLFSLPGGFMPGFRYGWYVNAHSAADGYVTSYYSRDIAFSGGAVAPGESSLAPRGSELHEDLVGSAPSLEK